MGLLSPSTVMLKFLLQIVCRASLDWDEILLARSLEKCIIFNSKINFLKPSNIKRYLNVSSTDIMKIDGFRDASPQACAAVAYLKNETDSAKVFLITARVSPVKPIASSKLELCVALLLTELIYAIKASLDVNKRICLWTESTITLS